MDLTKLKALEMPSEVMEVDILGEKQSVKVFAPDDVIAAKLYAAGTAPGKTDTEITIDVCRIALSACVPEMTAEDVEHLMAKALTTAALPMLAKARDLRLKYEEAKEKATGEMEKNLPGANSTPDKS